MLLIELRFLAGRYHATPWGRNVNEGAVEWPPSPYRLARALVDTCRRRRPAWTEGRLAVVIELMATPVSFRLPPAAAAHVRSFLSSNAEDSTKKQKIVDAFVVMDAQESVIAAFDCEPDSKVRGDLSDLLDEMSYFGRSESWVMARVVATDVCADINCVPAAAASAGQATETVQVACLRSSTDYEAAVPLRTVGEGQGKKKERARRLSWLEAMSLSTTDLLAQGWSAPPAQKMVNYLITVNALTTRPALCRKPLDSRFTVARFALCSKVLPRVIETVPFADRIRTHLMGIHRRVAGGDPSTVSPLFSGKDGAGRPAKGHEHAFVLPLDEDGDGRIDHLEVRVGAPFDDSELETLDYLRSVWQPDGRPDVDLVLIGLTAEPPALASKTWASATPFVTSRHYRKGRGAYTLWIEDEIRRECGNHGLPEPLQIQWIDHASGGGHAVRWMEFVRSRKGEVPLRGHGCILTFGEPVKGPFALGSLCHFGLGLFVPEETR